MENTSNKLSTSDKAIIYPGTFDPITNGHVDIIERAVRTFGKVIVAISLSKKKNTIFSLEKRKELAQQVLAHLPNVEICHFSSLLVDFARNKNVYLILRGLRAISDFEYEFQLAGLYRHLEPRIETVFLMPAAQNLYISSSMVREIASLGGNVSSLVPAPVQIALSDIYKS